MMILELRTGQLLQLQNYLIGIRVPTSFPVYYMVLCIICMPISCPYSHHYDCHVGYIKV